MNEVNALRILLWVMHGRCRSMLWTSALNNRGPVAQVLRTWIKLLGCLKLFACWLADMRKSNHHKPLPGYANLCFIVNLKNWNLCLPEISFLRQQLTDLIDVCRFESGREQIYTVMKYLLNLIWKFLLSLKGSF